MPLARHLLRSSTVSQLLDQTAASSLASRNSG